MQTAGTLLGSAPSARLVVEMERVAYVDSVVWGELAMAATRARGAGEQYSQ